MNRSEAGKLGYLKSIHKLKELIKNKKENYEISPNFCPFCKCKISYDKRRNKFCSHSCAASFNNKGVRKHGIAPDCCVVCGSLAKGRNKHCDNCISKKFHTNIKNKSEDIKCDSTLRAYMLRTRPYKCEICKISQWNEKQVPLEVDHIDGNSDNNKETNLRLLCSNCHMQLPTSKGKNIGKGRTRQKIKNKRYELGLKY